MNSLPLRLERGNIVSAAPEAAPAAAHLLVRLRLSERAIDRPWHLAASLALDAALTAYEAATGRAS